MRCPNCGQDLRDDDKFCANCGAPASLDTSPDPYRDPYGNPYGDSAAQPRPSVPIYVPPAVGQPVSAPRSFVTQAVITLVLYWLLWIPGLIANIVFWQEANRIEQETGRAPEGKGCLVALFIVYVILPAIVIFLAVVISVSAV